MNTLSRPVIVFLVLVGGVLLILLAQKPHSVCDSQIEVFKESQKGALYGVEFKGKKVSPRYGAYLETCRMGNSSGACYELFSLLKKLVRDLDAGPAQCLPEMSDVAPLKKVFYEQIELMAILAWGSQPPDRGPQRLNWYDSADVALFCSMKRLFIQIFGEDAYEDWREKVYVKFAGEAPIVREGVCINCSERKNALQVLSSEEIWVRSLFSVRCDQY